MALKDLFKRKKKKAKTLKSAKIKKPASTKKDETDKEKTAAKKTEKEKKETKKTTLPKKEKKRAKSEAFRILKSPHVTERATDLVAKNRYVFNVWKRTNKNEIKKAVEDIYGVDVLNVRIINVPAKKRKLGRIEGERAGYKKAIVRVKEGQKIEILPR